MVKDEQLKKQIEQDFNTISSNNEAAGKIRQPEDVKNLGCIAVVICVVLGMIVGAVSSGADGWMGGAFVGLVVGGFISKIISVIA